MASPLAFSLASEHSAGVTPDMSPAELAAAVATAMRARVTQRIIPLLVHLTRGAPAAAREDPFRLYVTAVDIRTIAELRTSHRLSPMECAYMAYLTAPIPPSSTPAGLLELYAGSQLPQPWRTVALLCNMSPTMFMGLFPHKEMAPDAAGELTLYTYMKKCVAPVFASDSAPATLAVLYEQLGTQLVQRMAAPLPEEGAGPEALTGLFTGVVLTSAGSRVK